jgi:WS/DGAT/MGAT family acyltransferase
MSNTRLSGMDASFLSVETPTAHMHVGWVARFVPPHGDQAPTFGALREHIASRLGRAPRYRQKLARVPFGVHAPEWIDDPAFSIDRHVYWAPGPVDGLVDEVLSVPLRRDRPLWEMWICHDADGPGFSIVGKLHHCMVDGMAALELGSLLLDSSPDAEHADGETWGADPEPGSERLLARALRDRATEQLGLLGSSLRVIGSPARTGQQTANGAARVARALGNALRPAPSSALNGPLSSQRTLSWIHRPFSELRVIKREFGTTVNDVLLAAVAGGMRSYLIRRGEEPLALKAMVPVSVRCASDVLGNRISFVFVDVPCNQRDPVVRLYRVHNSMSRRKRAGEPQGADTALRAAANTPVVGGVVSRIVASPRTFNLTVSNIPGMTDERYMLGCALGAVYPVVPLSDQHALSIGMVTVADRACFGVYADRERLPDASMLAEDIDYAIEELLARAERRPTGAGLRRLAAVPSTDRATAPLRVVAHSPSYSTASPQAWGAPAAEESGSTVYEMPGAVRRRTPLKIVGVRSGGRAPVSS